MPRYIRGNLSKIASWYYRNDYANNIRFEIYKAIEGKTHDRCVIEYEFSEEAAKEIKKHLKRINNERL